MDELRQARRDFADWFDRKWFLNAATQHQAQLCQRYIDYLWKAGTIFRPSL